MLIKYNVLAVIGAGVGLANSMLVWKLFGANINSDIWLLSVAIIAILSLLVLIGIEQFQVFYTEIYLKDEKAASQFLGAAGLWALASGILFSLICYGIVDIIINSFAGGLPIESKKIAIAAFLILLTQVAIAPLVHVTRCTLNVHQYYGASYCLSLILPIWQMIVLTIFIFLKKQDVVELAKWSCAAVLIQILSCPLILIKWANIPKNISVQFFGSFVKNSFTMRIGHSFHNFFVGLILNNALSHQAPGVISIFQYAKKFSDGLAGVAIGPQANIYHVRQAKAWSERNASIFYENIKVYLKNTLPLYVAGVICVWVFLPWLFSLLAKDGDASSTEKIKTVFLALSAWQGIISIETIFAGIVVIARRSMILWLVNGIFIFVFYFSVKAMPLDASVLWISITGLLSQFISFIFYAFLSWILVSKHFIKFK
ncbi:hypothetical protein [Janthinobacterium sp.]|uniref:hypothetical protein n=1 Tax=Janthinobacterium sp. TaxID=1871054 RepID=UPI00289EF736|nr:hypothetical protein [Janthinobacterium sp.]